MGGEGTSRHAFSRFARRARKMFTTNPDCACILLAPPSTRFLRRSVCRGQLYRPDHCRHDRRWLCDRRSPHHRRRSCPDRVTKTAWRPRESEAAAAIKMLWKLSAIRPIYTSTEGTKMVRQLFSWFRAADSVALSGAVV